MDYDLLSQDIFGPSQNQFGGPVGSPTKGSLLTEWRCEEATEASFLTCSLSWGSHQLPSLGIADNLPDIVEIENSNLCVSEFTTIEGIDELTGLAIKYHFFVVKDGKPVAVKNFLHVLSVFEHLGTGGKLPEDVLAHLDQALYRIAQKTDVSLNRNTEGLLALRNPCLHASLFTWKVAFTVFSADKNTTQETTSRRANLMDYVLNLTAVGLIRFYERFALVAPCNCIQGFVFMLFRGKRRFEQTIFLRVYQNSQKAQELLRSRVPAPLDYFNYYVAVAEYLLRLKKISESTEWSTNFVDRMFAMATKLESRHLAAVCETLAAFLLKHNHGSLESTKRHVRDLAALMIAELKNNPIQDLENMARDTPYEWDQQILKDFNDVSSKQKHVIRLMGLLVKDKDIGKELLTHYLVPLFSSLKTIARSSNSTVLSLLFHLLKVEPSLFQDLSSWLLSLADPLSDDESMLSFVFRANQLAQTISQLHSPAVEYDVNKTHLQLLNKIRLPGSATMFMTYVRELDLRNEPKEVDLTRTVTSLPDADFHTLLAHFSQSRWLLPVEVWRKAREMGDKGDRTAFEFYLNQLCLGMSLKRPFYSQQLKVLLEKYEKDKNFSCEMLSFLRNIFNSRNSDFNVDVFVSMWITAVLVFSESKALETSDVTHSIWEKLRQSSLVPQIDDIHLSQAPPVDYVIRLLEILRRNSKDSVHKLSIWFSPWLCSNLKSFATQTGSRRSLSLRVICGLLVHHAPALFSFAVENEQRQSFNCSIFVLAILAVTDKKEVCLDPVVRREVAEVISALARIPENKNKAREIFLLGRLRMFLTHYAEEEFDVKRMLDALKGKGTYLERLKRQDQLIKSLCETHGF